MKIIYFMIFFIICIISLFSTSVDGKKRYKKIKRVKRVKSEKNNKKDDKKEENINPGGNIQRNFTKNPKPYKPMKHSPYFLKTADQNLIKKRNE